MSEQARQWGALVREGHTALQGHSPLLLHPDRVIHLIEDAFDAGAEAARKEAQPCAASS